MAIAHGICHYLVVAIAADKMRCNPYDLFDHNEVLKSTVKQGKSLDVSFLGASNTTTSVTTTAHDVVLLVRQNQSVVFSVERNASTTSEEWY